MTCTVAYSLAFLLVGGIGATRATAAEDRHLFQPRVAVGDVYEVTEVIDFVVRETPSDPKAEEAGSPYVMHSETRTRREVLATTGGKATAVRLTFLVSRVALTGAGANRDFDQPYAGRTFLLEKKGGKVRVSPTSREKFDKGVIGKLAAMLDSHGPVPFPEVDLAPGEDWEAPMTEADGINKQSSGRTHAKFPAMTDHSGEPCAVIQVEQSAHVNPEAGGAGLESSVTASLKGELRYSLQRQRPIELELRGPFQIPSPAAPNGSPSPGLSGECRQSYREKWIKVAGKPVPDAPAANSDSR